jgi:serine/threonine protein kinase
MDYSPTLCVGPPDTPDKYALIRQIGGGGEAVMWLAELSIDGAAEPVAVKELRTERLHEIERHSSRWAEQAELLRFVRHPGVVAVREHFQGSLMHRTGEGNETDRRSLYLVMNWVEGCSLGAWVASNRDLVGSEEALSYLEQVATVLDLLHSGQATPSGREIVHGDISPENVMITSAGQAVLIDFGLVRVSSHNTQTVAGTPGYTAPEVWTSGSYGTAGDRYSYGALAYLMLIGTTPPSTPTDLRAGLAAHPRLRGAGPAALDRLMTIFSPDPITRPPASEWLRLFRNCAPTQASLDMAAEQTDARQPPPAGLKLEETSRDSALAAREQSHHRGEPVYDISEPAPRPRVKALYLLLGLAAVALLLAAFFIVPQLGSKPTDSAAPVAPGQGEIFAEPADAPGPDPFTASAVTPPTPAVTPVSVPSSSTGVASTASLTGGTAGLYGGHVHAPNYNQSFLVSSLQSDPVKLAGFTQATQIPASVSVVDYFNGLTPLVIRETIRVTSYGWRNGKLVTYQAILQVGTVVLVDKFGVPRVRAGSGSPLAAPIAVVGTPTYQGVVWANFDTKNVFIIAPAGQPMSTFAVYDLIGGQMFVRPAGTFGPQDYIPGVPAAVAAPPVVAKAAPHRVIQAKPHVVKKLKRHEIEQPVDNGDQGDGDSSDNSDPGYNPPTQEVPATPAPQHYCGDHHCDH